MATNLHKHNQRRRAAAADIALDGYAALLRDASADDVLLRALRAFAAASPHNQARDAERLKAVTAAAAQAAAAAPDSPAWRTSAQLLLELLFVQHSRPLHKQLLSVVKKLPASHQEAVGELVAGLVARKAAAVLLAAGGCEQQQLLLANGGSGNGTTATLRQQVSAAVLAPPAATLSADAAQQGLHLSQAAMSLLQLPAARGWLAPCAALLLLAVARSVAATLDPVAPKLQQAATDEGTAAAATSSYHLTPQVVELVQDCINVMYMLLQQHGQAMAQAATAAGDGGRLEAAAICTAARSMLTALQGALVVREALASAGVVVWAAALLPAVPSPAAAVAFAAGLMPEQLVAAGAGSQQQGGGCSARAAVLLDSFRSSSLLEAHLAAGGSSLVTELQHAPAVAHVCALRGLMSAMPAAALAGDLGLVGQPPQQQSQHQQQSQQQGCFLMQCALPYALAALRAAADVHQMFYAASLLAAALQAARHVWGQLAEQHVQQTQQSEEGAAVNSAPRANGSSSSSLVAPWLSAADAQAVMALLWGHLDAPVAQVLSKVQECFEALLVLITAQHATAQRLGLQPPPQPAAATAGAVPGTSGVAEAAASGSDALIDPQAFLMSTAQGVLALPAGRKGRYNPLMALLPHVGATTLLQLQPGLVRGTLDAMQSNLAASAAAQFFKAWLLQLRSEVQPAGGAGPGRPGGAVPWQEQQQPSGQPGQSSTAGLVAAHVPAALRPWCCCWLPELLDALWCDGERSRAYVAGYGLPMVLQAEPLLLRPLVDIFLAAHAADVAAAAAAALSGSGSSSSARGAAAALVVVLRTARRLQLLGDLDALLLPHEQQPCREGDGQTVSPVSMLLTAMSSASAALRTETLELVCINARSTEAPGVLELLLAKRWLMLNLRCTGAESRHKSLAVWEKLLCRQAAAVRAIRHRAAVSKTPGATGGAHPKALPRASTNYLAMSAAPGATATAATAAAPAAVSDAEAEARQLEFLQWLTTTLLDSLYPGAPYERRYFALELLALLLQQWVLPPSAKQGGGGKSSGGNSTQPLPFCADLFSAGSVQTLLTCIIDSWDKMRLAASRVLELLPSPLPGFETPQQLQELLCWALALQQSPRVRESDAGALTLRLLVRKYLVGLEWSLRAAPQPAVECSATAAAAAPAAGAGRGASSGAVASDALVAAAAGFLASLTAQLRARVEDAAADMAAASKCGLFHGILLSVRCCVDVMPWAAMAGSSCRVTIVVSAAAVTAASSSDGGGAALEVSPADGDGRAAGAEVAVSGPACGVLNCWISDLALLLAQATELVRPLLCAQDVNIAANEVEEPDDDDAADAEDDAAAEDGAEGAASSGGLSGPAVQLLISTCWTSWKEASLLIGTLARRLPLPTATSSDGRCQLLTAAQLEQLGALQLCQLLDMKHNGAVEKSQAGFIALAARLLESPEPALNQLPRAWLERALARAMVQGQSRDDITRRSAGLPFAICSLFLAEPVGTPKVLLPHGVAQLLSIACDDSLAEPWPRVHAFNTLRHVFSDASLAFDTSGFHAAGVVAAINGMTDGAWEVRNAAALAFTALLMRVVGARNIDARQQQLLKPLKQLEAAAGGLHIYGPAAATADGGGSSSSSKAALLVAAMSKGPMAADFFFRYPQLHAFLLEQLQGAVQQQQQCERGGGLSSSGSSSVVPPSLFPTLLTLARLRPSLLVSVGGGGGGDESSSSSSAAAADAAVAPPAVEGFDAAVYTAAVMQVGSSPVMGVRKAAAAALAPLVPAEQLHATCLQLAQRLPSSAAGDAATTSGIQGRQEQPPELSHNALHGALLQLTALLSAASSSTDSSCSSRASCESAALLVHELLPAFVGSSWLLQGSCRCSCAIKQEYSAAVGQLLVLAHRQWALLLATSSNGSSTIAALRQLADALHASCTAAVAATTAGGRGDGPGVEEPYSGCWLRDCAALLLGPLLQVQVLLRHHHQQQQQQQPQGEALLPFHLQQLSVKLQLCLQSSSYELRAAALKAAAVTLDRLRPVVLGATSSSDSSAASVAVAAAIGSISSCVWAALQGEPVLKAVKRLLRVLGQVQPLERRQGSSQNADQQPPLSVTATDEQRARLLIGIAETCKQPAVRTAALACAARLLRCWDSSQPVTLRFLRQLLQCIDGFSQQHQPEEVRAAAAAALQLSGLLTHLAPMSSAGAPPGRGACEAGAVALARLSLSAWATALKLLEDEDEGVRQAAASAAHQVLQAVPPTTLRLNAAAVDGDAAAASPTAAAPAQLSHGGCHSAAAAGGACVEAVEAATFGLLAASSAAWPALAPGVLQLLCGNICDPAAPQVQRLPLVLLQQQPSSGAAVGGGAAGGAAAGGAAAGGAAAAAAAATLPAVSVRRLFEREADNHHEETLLLAQHAAAAMRHTLRQGLLADAAAASMAQAMQGWCSLLVQRVVASAGANEAGSGDGTSSSVQTLTHAQAFVPLYCACLGLWAAGPWLACAAGGAETGEAAQLAADVRRLAGLLAQAGSGAQQGALRQLLVALECHSDAEPSSRVLFLLQ